MALAAMAVCRAWTLGRSRWCTTCTAAMCMAAGNVSFEDWPRFTWSLGWTGVLLPSSPPVSWMARLLITSLTFMFDWVPRPGLPHEQREVLVQLPVDDLVAHPDDQIGH